MACRRPTRCRSVASTAPRVGFRHRGGGDTDWRPGRAREGLRLSHFFRDSCEVRYADSDLLESAVDRWMTFGGKLSLSDAVSLEIMAREDISEIVSFDSDFDGIEGVVRKH